MFQLIFCTKPDPNDEWWREALDIHKELGCRYIVMSRLPDYPTDEVIAEYATYFNRIGELAAERGMQFCYHPRQQEMTMVNGKSAFETIAANTDPEKVHFEIDTYEATEAEVDVDAISVPIDSRGISDLLGTIAGDNTILLILRENFDKEELMEQLCVLFPSLRVL